MAIDYYKIFISANGWRVYEMDPLQNIYDKKVRYEHHLHNFERSLLENVIRYGLPLKNKPAIQVSSATFTSSTNLSVCLSSSLSIYSLSLCIYIYSLSVSLCLSLCLSVSLSLSLSLYIYIYILLKEVLIILSFF